MSRGQRCLVLAAVLIMAACGIDDAESDGPTTVVYRGQTLHCVTFSNAYGDSASCDFERFYAEHPDLLASREAPS